MKFKPLAADGENVNGGIQFRSHRIAGTQVKDYQADIGVFKNYLSGKFWGCLFENAGRALLAGDAAANEKLVKKGDWNQYVIRCEGLRIQLWLDRHQTIDYTEKAPDYERTGIIGLQVHAGPPEEMWYKDIVVKDLLADH